MTETIDRDAPRRRPVREFFQHLIELPRWQKTVLLLASMLTVAGVAGQVSLSATKAVKNQSSDETKPSMPTGGMHAFDPSGAPKSTSTPAPSPTFVQRVSPYATRVGLGLVGGFIIGWAFRAFIKMMTTITLGIVMLLTALSYFNVMNVDLTSAEGQFKSGGSWVSDQATRLKDAALAHIPGSATSFIGFFLGFRRS